MIPFAANAAATAAAKIASAFEWPGQPPEIAPSFSFGFRHPARGEPSHGHGQHAQKNW